MKRRTLRYAMLFSLCAALAACGGSTVTGSGSSAVSISISRGTSEAPAASVAAPAVSSLAFTISGDGMTTITRTATIAAAQSVTETFDVPNGLKRLFVVEAKDAGGVVIYQGSETVDLSGEAVTLNITLNPVSSGLTPVTITITLAGQAGLEATNLVFTIKAPDMETITRTDAVSASRTLTDVVLTGNRLLGTAQDDIGSAIARDSNGNLFIAGYTETGFTISSVTTAFDVPDGTERSFTVEARDAGGRLVASGNATADLTGTAAALDIQLTPGQTFSYSAFLAKVGSSGQMLYSRQFGTPDGTQAYSIAADGNGNVFVAGGTGGNLDGEANHGFTDGFVAKFDSAGSRVWTRLIGDIGDDLINAVTVDASGNVYVTGFIGSTAVPSNGNSEVFAAKLDPNGNLQNIGLNTQPLIRLESSAATNSGEAIAIDAGGNVYVAGFTDGVIDASQGNQNHGGFDLFVSKINTLGITVTAQLGTADLDQASSIAVDAADMVYVAGQTYGNLEGNNNTDLEGLTSDMFVVKFDATSATTLPTLQFAKLVGTTGNDVVNAIAVDTVGNVFLAGSTNGAFAENENAGGYDSVVVKVLPEGVFDGAQQIGTPNRDEANAVLIDSANNVFVAGSTKGVFDGIQSRGFDAFLIMYDANGVKQ